MPFFHSRNWILVLFLINIKYCTYNFLTLSICFFFQTSLNTNLQTSLNINLQTILNTNLQTILNTNLQTSLNTNLQTRLNTSKYNEFSSANIIMMIDIFRMNKKQLDKVKQLWVHYLILIKKSTKIQFLEWKKGILHINLIDKDNTAFIILNNVLITV
jgi:hypothetical protein